MYYFYLLRGVELVEELFLFVALDAVVAVEDHDVVDLVKSQVLSSEELLTYVRIVLADGLVFPAQNDVFVGLVCGLVIDVLVEPDVFAAEVVVCLLNAQLDFFVDELV